MSLRSTTTHWGGVVRLFHWGMLLGFAGIVTVGYYMADLPNGPGKAKIFALHKSVGVTLLALAVLRLAWRFGDRRPAPAPAPAWQLKAASAVQGLLYLLMFAVPLVGWVYSSAAGFPPQWFGLFSLPALTGTDPVLKPIFKELHENGAVALLVVVGLHAVAALKHHFLDRDDTLRSMLPPR